MAVMSVPFFHSVTDENGTGCSHCCLRTAATRSDTAVASFGEGVFGNHGWGPTGTLMRGMTDLSAGNLCDKTHADRYTFGA